MKIYISGQVTGLPFDEVTAKFNEAEKYLLEKGFEVISPLKTGIPYAFPWESHIAMDILFLLGCDAIYLLPNWNQSKGATLEKTIAELTDKKIIYQEIPVFFALQQAIYEVMDVSFYDIVSENRKRNNVYARMIYAYFSKKRGATITGIATEIRRNHSTVIYYLKKFEDEMKYNSFFRGIVNIIEIAIKSKEMPQISN
ncbi:MAG: DUF4406 domain-containing protein [Prevotellaceae bacterium]|jgi:hypothetical protein|nr:DUF4406 domain-containing protein [Prevotellaceae bacterium]